MALHKKCNQKREKSFYCIFMRAAQRERKLLKYYNIRLQNTLLYKLKTELNV